MPTHRIYIETPVDGHYPEVFKKFDRRLFENLQPSFPPSKIIRYDGNSKGDRVMLKVWTGLTYENWESVITENACNEHECFFIDEGTQLPWFLKKWKHRHIVRKAAFGSLIIDEIEMGFINQAAGLLFYSFLKGTFKARQLKYQAYFRSEN
ncbi:MAG: hypothetical protein SFW35_14175 [Chitinophagales bacterium]|nr:hypothetical protein [Chitinophagales bacterium]